MTAVNDNKTLITQEDDYQFHKCLIGACIEQMRSILEQNGRRWWR